MWAIKFRYWPKQWWLMTEMNEKKLNMHEFYWFSLAWNEWMQKSSLAREKEMKLLIGYKIYLDLNDEYPFNLLYIVWFFSSFATISMWIKIFDKTRKKGRNLCTPKILYSKPFLNSRNFIRRNKLNNNKNCFTIWNRIFFFFFSS